MVLGRSTLFSDVTINHPMDSWTAQTQGYDSRVTSSSARRTSFPGLTMIIIMERAHSERAMRLGIGHILSVSPRLGDLPARLSSYKISASGHVRTRGLSCFPVFRSSLSQILPSKSSSHHLSIRFVRRDHFLVPAYQSEACNAAGSFAL